MRLMSIVEATPATGLGRLARSLAVAEALREQGHEVVLTGHLELPGANAIVDESGYQVVTGDHSPIGLARVAEEQGAERVLVDCAAYPDGLADLLTARGVRTACFRDGLNGSHSATGVDLVIAPAWSPVSSVDVAADGSVRATGPDYAPVRAAAREAAERREARAGGMGDRPRLLVLLGDGRRAEAMLPVAQWVANSDVSADVLCVGGTEVQRRRAEVQSTRRVRILATGWRPDLPRLVADHDLVVSFGRHFSWEVACIGTPMALLAVSPADVPALEATADVGAAIWLGRPGDAQSPAGRLRTAMRDGMRRREVASQASRLVDGGGAARVADLLTR